MTLHVKIMLPEGILFQRECLKVVGEAENGSFSLLPNHIDFVTSLRPGILLLQSDDGEETYFAVDQGILVKKERSVMISTLHGVRGALGELRDAVQRQQEARAAQEFESRSALDRLEASLVRQILQWEGGVHA